MLGIGLSVPEQAVLRQGFTPSDLGASLYDAWDAERADLISLSGSAVTAWASTKNAYSAAQAVGAARPVYSATSFNGRPGITFDASDDQLTYAGVGVFPVGAVGCEMWALVDQTVPGATVSTLRIIAYGGITNNDSRFLTRGSSAGANFFSANVGTGGASTSSAVTTPPFDGRHVVRGVISPTTTTAYVEASTVVGTAAVPATASTMTRIGAGTNGAGFLGGVISYVAITAELTAPQAAAMLAYLKARGGIA